MTTFDKHSAFLSDATIAVAESHELHGALGSSLLSLRNDLRTFLGNERVHNLGLSLIKKADSCREQYVVRLKGHLLKISITSHKPNSVAKPARRLPDGAVRIQMLNASLEQHFKTTVKRAYGKGLQDLIVRAFVHNSETCTFQVDYETDEWNLYFQDAKNRTLAEIEIHPNEEATTASSLLPIRDPLAETA